VPIDRAGGNERYMFIWLTWDILDVLHPWGFKRHLEGGTLVGAGGDSRSCQAWYRYFAVSWLGGF